MRKKDEIVLSNDVKEKQKKNIKPIFKFKNDYFRLLAEFIIFFIMFVYVELMASLKVGYSIKYFYILMFLLSLVFIFLSINLIKNWIARFVVYAVLGGAFFGFTIVNILYPWFWNICDVAW